MLTHYPTLLSSQLTLSHPRVHENDPKNVRASPHETSDGIRVNVGVMLLCVSDAKLQNLTSFIVLLLFSFLICALQTYIYWLIILLSSLELLMLDISM